MLETIEIRRLSDIRDHLPFPYRDYTLLHDRDEIASSPFLSIGSSTAKLRPRCEWNTLGREVYDSEAIEHHAAFVSHILQDMTLTEFLLQHVVPDALWFRGNIQGVGDRVGAALTYLQSRGVAVDFSVWQGGFVVRGESTEFLKHFVDYPYLLNYYDLEMLSTQAPLMMELNHHLGIVYTSNNITLMEGLRARIVSAGIWEFPARELNVTDGGGVRAE